MSDEVEVVTPKRKGGWPAGKPRAKKVEPEAVKQAADRAELRAKSPPSLLSKMKAKPNWESEDFAGVEQDGVDRLKIPDDILMGLHRDGVALQWITRSVRGQEMPQELANMTRGGWTPVHQSDFDGILDGLFMSKGADQVIVHEDCMLVARPVEIQSKARMAQHREARRPLQITEDQLGRGIPGVTGGDHPTATRGNTIRKTLERIEIPE